MKIANNAGPLPVAWTGQGADPNTTAVRSGESTLSHVALRLGVAVEDLRKANPGLAGSDGLKPGLELRIPRPSIANAGARETDAASDASAAPASLKKGEAGLDAALMRAQLTSRTGGFPGNAMPAHFGASGSGGITQQPPVADPVRERTSPDFKKQTLEGLRTVYQSPEFKRLNSAEQKTVLQTLASNPPLTPQKISKTLELLGSAQGLSAADRKLVLDGFRASHADPAYAGNLKRLIEDPKLKSLGEAEKTAVLSQTRNYPDARSVGNIQRMLQKDWFTAQDLGDKQRSLKLVARLSQHPPKGDERVIGNTLDRLVGETSDYKLNWKTYPPGDGYFGEAGLRDRTLYLNKGYIAPGNDKMIEDETTNHLALNTTAHEVNHLVNGDRVANTFRYFGAEYRAWYVGFQSQHGRVPTNQEAMEQRIRWQFDPDSFYGKRAAEAMKDPAEAQQFYDFLGRVTGAKVDAGNWRAVLASDPVSWPNLSESPAPAPAGNIDNR